MRWLILQPLCTWEMTSSLSWNTCCFRLITTDPSSEFSTFKIFTRSSSLLILSIFRSRHFEAATRFLCRFRSSFILSCWSMLMGSSPSIEGSGDIESARLPPPITLESSCLICNRPSLSKFVYVIPPPLIVGFVVVILEMLLEEMTTFSLCDTAKVVVGA